MPLPALIVPFLMSVAAAEEPPIIVKAYPWAPFISPMGEPFRPPSTGEAPIARWFVRADRNQDGMLTTDEMQADADRFFARLDSNHDGQIDPRGTHDLRVGNRSGNPGELGLETAAGRDRRRAPNQDRDRPADDGARKRADDQHDGYRIDGLQGAARYGLLNIPQPVASADADFNRVITLTEFRQTALYRFKLLDGQGQGRITLSELEARLPARPKGKQAKPRKDAVDPRIGLPLPKGE